MGWDILVAIATRYVLDGPGIQSRWRARFSTSIQSGPGAYSDSCVIDTCFLSWGKVAGAWRWPSTPCGRLKREKKYTYTPLQSSFVASYWGESWSPTLREECMLKVSKSKVLRKIFELKWDVIVSK